MHEEQTTTTEGVFQSDALDLAQDQSIEITSELEPQAKQSHQKSAVESPA
jgi:hypothetical protein